MAYRIPCHIEEAIERYVEERCPVVSFLASCFANDLTQAIIRADESSLTGILEIVKFIHNETPSLCHGSRERVRRWLNRTEMEDEDGSLLGA